MKYNCTLNLVPIDENLEGLDVSSGGKRLAMKLQSEAPNKA